MRIGGFISNKETSFFDVPEVDTGTGACCHYANRWPTALTKEVRGRRGHGTE